MYKPLIRQPSRLPPSPQGEGFGAVQNYYVKLQFILVLK